MTQHRPGPIRRLIVGVWDAVNFSRRLVLNGLFLLVLAIFFAALLATPGVQPIKKKTALVLALDGQLVEQFTSTPVDRMLARATGDDVPQFQLRDLLEAIEAAKTDRRIDRIVLLTDGFEVAGFAALREFANALREFRDSGKPVVAYGTDMSQKAYYLAAQANEVYIDPQGTVTLEGLGRYRLYYREGLQDKLGVDVQLFRVGEYKSAMEPYILDGASPESREADLFWMNDLWQRFVADIAKARGIEPEALHALTANMADRVEAVQGDLSKLALDEKLVDGLKTAQEFDDALIEQGALDDDAASYRQIDLTGYLSHLRRQHLGSDKRSQVAVVVAQGDIVGGEQAPGMVGGESTSALVRQAREDDAVKALVLRVDSPGGGVFPSEQIRREVELTRAAGKPVIVSMGNVAASGGYWISMNADRIYADESTITGSIGIYGLWMSVPRVLEKLGVHSDGVGTTALAGAFDPTRPLNPDVGRIVQSVIEKGYRDFTGKVAAARSSTPEAIDHIARGRVWSGAQAKERGLVDEFGGIRVAIAEAAKRAKLEAGDYGVDYIEKPLGNFEKFLVDIGGEARFARLVQFMVPSLRGLDRATLTRIDHELVWLDRHSRRPYYAVAHCLCGL